MLCGGSSGAVFHTSTIHSLWFNTTNLIQHLKTMYVCLVWHIYKNKGEKDVDVLDKIHMNKNVVVMY